MTLLTLAEPDLVRACRILFGSDLQINRDFLEYLQLAGVKSAFRKKAIETHPDRVATAGELVRSRHAALFMEAQQAYRDLALFLEAREKGFRLPSQSALPRSSCHHSAAGNDPRPRERQPADPRPPSRPGQDPGRWPDPDPGAARFYQGPLPERPLLFGHFLYYSGAITWRMIIQAISWQRAQRPRLGQLGQRFGWLTVPEVIEILRASNIAQPFGQRAINLGLLNERQVKMLLLQQQRLHKKIGEFFLQEKILTPLQLQELLVRAKEHNRRLAGIGRNKRYETR
jgi:hypothetical protein